MKRVNGVFFAFLAGIILFAAYRYVALFVENRQLHNTLAEKEQQIVSLNEEKQNLLQTLEKEKEAREKLIKESAGLRDYLRASKQRLSRLFSAYTKKENELDTLSSQFSILKVERDALQAKNTEIISENSQLTAKLSSIVELKKAIRELKRHRRLSRKLGKDASVNKQTDSDGNQGFVIKDGVPSVTQKTRVEVSPAAQDSR
jgi:uncharacterized protein (DUF3084 family)